MRCALSQKVTLCCASCAAFLWFGAPRNQVQGAYFDFAGQWTRSHTFTSPSDVVTDRVLRDFKNFVYERQKEVGGGGG